jgi:polysaccharide biosynthesis protein PslA
LQYTQDIGFNLLDFPKIAIGANITSTRQAQKSQMIALALTVLTDLAILWTVSFCIPLLKLNPVGFDTVSRLTLVLSLIYFFAGIYSGVFEFELFKLQRAYIGRAPKTLIFAFFLLFILLFLTRAGLDFSRLVVALLAVASIPGIAIGRWALFPLVSRLADGAGPSAVMINDGVPGFDRPGMTVIDAASAKISTDLTNLGNVERIAQLASEVGNIIVCCPPERRHAWAKLLKCVAVQSEILVPELDKLRPLSLSSVGQNVAVVVSQHPLAWHQAATKRVFDLVVSASILIVLSPVLIVTAMAIRIESPGPALFRQKRLGFGNRMFVMLKFRSMRSDRADITASKLTRRNDDRVTRVGAFVRRTSIDELPQLINVLLGDMSLVGPRPHAPAALAGDKLYWEVDDKYWQRHIAKPGITGLAQIRGFRGNTFEEIDLQSRLDADLEYVLDWSLTRDIEILLATFRVISHDKAF